MSENTKEYKSLVQAGILGLMAWVALSVGLIPYAGWMLAGALNGWISRVARQSGGMAWVSYILTVACGLASFLVVYSVKPEARSLAALLAILLTGLMFGPARSGPIKDMHKRPSA